MTTSIDGAFNVNMGGNKSSCSKTNITKLSCVYFNARSVVNKLIELDLLLKEDRPDVVGITETWLHNGIDDSELNFEGYTLFRTDRNNLFKQKGGGVALFIKDNLNPILCDNYSNANFPEAVFCSVNMVNSCTIIGVVYRPPDSLLQNDEGLYDLLGKVLGKAFVIMGDFNFVQFDWGKPNTLDLPHKFIDGLGMK